MNDPINVSVLTTAIQAVGIMLVAGLLLPMTRAIPGRFLRYWTVGWLCLTVARFALIGSFKFPAVEPPLLTLYCLTEYLFGFMLWAGCREFATGRLLRPRHGLILAPLAAVALVTPFVVAAVERARAFDALFPFHAVLVGLLFLLALLATRSYRPRERSPGVGIWLLRASLGGLMVLNFLHAAAVLYLTYVNPSAKPEYLSYTSLYDLLLEIGLAFGMVVVATDRLRDELEEKNRQLEAAATELAHAARTDALTGLLNRRAFDELPANKDTAVAAGSLAVLDLNDLKLLNDRYGHAAGDVALQLVARTLRVQFRVTDPLYRTGGDEFVVVASGLAEPDLAARLANVDQALHGLRLPGVAAPTDVVISWGVASFRSAAGLAEAYRQADEAMYQCKKQRKARAAVAVQ